MTKPELMKMTKLELIAALKALDTNQILTGNKPVLVERLIAARAAQQSPASQAPLPDTPAQPKSNKPLPKQPLKADAPLSQKNPFQWNNTFYDDINSSKEGFTMTDYFKLMKSDLWTEQRSRSTRGQNLSDVDEFEQSRVSFHESGNDQNNLGPYLTHLESSYSKKNIPSFEQWKVTILHDVNGDPDPDANDTTRYITHFNRLLTAHYPVASESKQWRLNYQMYDIEKRQLQEFDGYVVPTGSTNPGGAKTGFVHVQNTSYNKLAPPQDSDASKLSEMPTKHPGDGMAGSLICQDWDPGNVNTWSLLGWHKHYNVLAWNPAQTALPGFNPMRIEALTDTYNKTRSFNSHWQLLAWMVLYDKDGNYNFDASKWALAPGRMPRRQWIEIFNALHWTQSGSSQRLIRTQDSDSQNVSYVPDSKDAHHWTSYGDCPFSHSVLYDMNGYQAAPQQDPTDLFAGAGGGGVAAFPRTDQFGSVTISPLGRHLLGPLDNSNEKSMFPRSLHLNNAEQFETIMGNEPEVVQLAVLRVLVKAFAAILTLYHDEFPGQMMKLYFDTNTDTMHNLLTPIPENVTKSNNKLLAKLQKVESLTGGGENGDELIAEIAVLFKKDLLKDARLLDLVVDTLNEMGQGDVLNDAFMKDIPDAMIGATEVITDARHHPFVAVVVEPWPTAPLPAWAALGANGRNHKFRKGDGRTPIEMLLNETVGHYDLNLLTLKQLKDFAVKHLPVSQMSVYEFMNSPYNCVYLPLVETNSVLDDMESMSPVCTRCVRPFFENQFVYAVWGTVSKGEDASVKNIMAAKPGRKPKGSERKHQIDKNACGQPFNLTMENHSSKRFLEKATPRHFKLQGTDEDLKKNMTQTYIVKGPVYGRIPEKLYFFWDPDNKRSLGLVYTRYPNYMHPEVQDPKQLMTTKGYVGVIDQGYIRQNDFSIKADKQVVYNHNRLGFAFCQKLHLERVNDRSNICLDCYNELGGDGRKGMNLITKPFSHNVLSNPRLYNNEEILNAAKKESNPNFFLGVSTDVRTERPVRVETGDGFDDAMKKVPVARKAAKEGCDDVKADGPTITKFNWWKNIECLTTRPMLLNRLFYVEQEIYGEDEIDGDDFELFRTRMEELAANAPVVEPAEGQQAVITQPPPQVITPGSFTLAPAPSDAPPIDEREAAQQYQKEVYTNKQQAKANLDLMTAFVTNLTTMSMPQQEVVLRNQLAKEVTGQFGEVAHILRQLLVQLRLQEATTVERMSDNGFPDVFDHTAKRIEIRNNNAYPGQLLGRTIRYPKLRNKMLKALQNHTEYEVIDEQQVFTVQNGQFDVELHVDEDDSEGAPPSVKDHPLKYVRFFFESGQALQAQGGVHFVGMIDTDSSGNVLPHEVQERTMKMTHVFITWVLHKRAVNTDHNRVTLSKISAAASHLFNTSEHLSTLCDFGKMMQKDPDGNWEQVNIGNAHKASNVDNHPASYPNDTFTSHMDHTRWQGGAEIGPFHRFFHFHATIKLVHWSKIMVNYFTMREWLARAFRGLDRPEWYLADIDGRPLYKQSETPHIDIQLLPQDGWEKVISDYLFKDAVDRRAREEAGVFGSMGAANPGHQVSNAFSGPPSMSVGHADQGSFRPQPPAVLSEGPTPSQQRQEELYRQNPVVRGWFTPAKQEVKVSMLETIRRYGNTQALLEVRKQLEILNMQHLGLESATYSVRKVDNVDLMVGDTVLQDEWGDELMVFEIQFRNALWGLKQWQQAIENNGDWAMIESNIGRQGNMGDVGRGHNSTHEESDGSEDSDSHNMGLNG